METIYKLIFVKLLSKKNLILALPLLVFLLFKNQIDHKALELIKHTSLYFFPSPFCDFLFFIGATLSICGYGLLFRQKYKPNNQVTFYLLVVAIIYGLSYRMKPERFYLTPLEDSPQLFYADIMLIICCLHLLLFVYNKILEISPIYLHYLNTFSKQYPERWEPFVQWLQAGLRLYVIEKSGNQSVFTLETTFDDDKGIPERSDSLKRGWQANLLAEEILKIDSTKSFAIGITANWGQGKSYFIAMIMERLKHQKNVLTIEFNPWKNNSPQSIISHFFNNLNLVLSEYSGNISSSIEGYAELLLNADTSELSKVFFKNIAEQRTIDDHFNSINEAIRKTGKKIVVVIDDIDRLDKTEVIEVIRLIRNTGNFNNTIFLAAYDRGYVLEAIKQLNEHNADRYLEKIFQIQHVLPPIDRGTIRSHLVDILNARILEFNFNDVFVNDVDSATALNKIRFPLVEYYLENLRNVIQFCNSFVFNYKHLKEIVDMRDLFYLELIKFKHPNIYAAISNEEGILIHDGRYSLAETEDSFNKKFALGESTAWQTIEVLFDKSNTSSTALNLPNRFLLYFKCIDDPALYQEFLSFIENKNPIHIRETLQSWANEPQGVSKCNSILEYVTQKKHFNPQELGVCVYIACVVNSILPFNEKNFYALMRFMSKALIDELGLNTADELEIYEAVKNTLSSPECSKILIANVLTQLNNLPHEYFVTEEFSLEILNNHFAGQDFNLSDNDTDVYLFLLAASVRNATELAQWPIVLNLSKFTIGDTKLLPSIYKVVFAVDSNPESEVERISFSCGLDIRLGNVDRVMPFIEPMLTYCPFSCELLRLKGILHKIKNGASVVELPKHTFELFSSNELNFIKAEASDNNSKSGSGVEFIHPHWHKDVIGHDSNFNGIKWVAHTDPGNLHLNEAHLGGKYYFKWSFDLPEINRITAVSGAYCVDDRCSFEINGSKVLALEDSSTGSHPRSFFNLRVADFYNNNACTIMIENTSFETTPIGRFEITENPYGIIFYLQFKYNPIN